MSKKKRYPPRFPRYASGIRLQGARQEKADSWWARRWMESVVEKDIGGREGRGKAYAMSGQVTALEIEGNVVKARVAGLREKPYEVVIRFRMPEGSSRDRILRRLKTKPGICARLANGDMPLETAEIFRHEKMDLFPGGKLAEDVYDVTTSCSCPDWANPCKHSFAVLALLGEEIAIRPWRLLELRGISIEEAMP